ncbi:MAG: Rrf2 family transcriptional regulator [Myxococcota bacterium]
MNTHFPIALHALTLLAQAHEHLLTSEKMAESVNTNPVFLRRVLKALKQAEIIETRRGAGGGIALTRPPSRITLADVYRAIRAQKTLFVLHSEPNPDCGVGGNIQDVLSGYFEQAEQKLLQHFERYSIRDIIFDLPENGVPVLPTLGLQRGTAAP